MELAVVIPAAALLFAAALPERQGGRASFCKALATLGQATAA
jgi:hypothetical protein